MITTLSLLVLLIAMTQFSISENVKKVMLSSGDSITLDFKRSIIRYLMSPIVFCTFFIMIVALVDGEGFIFLVGLVMFSISSYGLLVKLCIPHSAFYALTIQSLLLIILAFFS